MCETLSVQEPMCGGHAGAVWLECISAGQLCVREDKENLIRRRKTNTETKKEGEVSLRAWNESVIVGVTMHLLSNRRENIWKDMWPLFWFLWVENSNKFRDSRLYGQTEHASAVQNLHRVKHLHWLNVCREEAVSRVHISISILFTKRLERSVHIKAKEKQQRRKWKD